jgi:metallophosphoesterase (TIGR00282 family)
VRILFFGDVVGRVGRLAMAAMVPRWRQAYAPDIVIANGENAAGGMGITAAIAQELHDVGVDVITLGNHTFAQKGIETALEDDTCLLRPANYPAGTPGYGYGIYPAGGAKLAVINLMGRVFMDPLDDPFAKANELVHLCNQQTHCMLIDIHAEATSEKAALAWMLDGQVSAVVGTHTHVPTADERLLPGGTAFITDVGMVGPRDAILGVRAEIIVTRFRTWRPSRFEIAEGPAQVQAVLVECDPTTGRATRVTRLSDVVETAR